MLHRRLTCSTCSLSPARGSTTSAASPTLPFTTLCTSPAEICHPSQRQRITRRRLDGGGTSCSRARACVCASPAPELRSTLQLRDRGGGVCGRWPACDGAATASPRGESRSPSGAGAGPRDSRRGPVRDTGLSSRVQRGRPLAPCRGPLLLASRPGTVGLSASSARCARGEARRGAGPLVPRA